jgi:hypothetical protein
MSYETKVILQLLGRLVAKSKSVKEAYGAIEAAANAEGVTLPSYNEATKKLQEEEDE